MIVALVGYRGSGKTTVGRKLAERLGFAFLDTDEFIIQSAGKSIKDIFAINGEAVFRDMESQSLTHALSQDRTVVSLGGGAVLREENRKLLQQATYRVYLKCDAKTLYHRIHSDTQTASNRPALTALGGGIEEITQLLAEREPLYQKIANIELDVTNLSANVVVSRLLTMIDKRE